MGESRRNVGLQVGTLEAEPVATWMFQFGNQAAVFGSIKGGLHFNQRAEAWLNGIPRRTALHHDHRWLQNPRNFMEVPTALVEHGRGGIARTAVGRRMC